MSLGVDFTTLKRLAGLKAKKAQIALAAARREADRAAAAVANTDRAAQSTYDPPTEPDAWIAQWRLRAALEELRGIQHHTLAERQANAERVAAVARHETARELGTAALEADQAKAQRLGDARRMDRITDTLAALRKPPMR